MNRTKHFVLGVLVCFGTASFLQAETTTQLTDEKSKVSYAIGMMLGHNWQQQGLDVDADIAASAIKAVQSSNTTLLTVEEAQETLRNFQKEFMAKQQQKRAEEAAKNKADGEAFLAANKQKPGVETLPDGLQYLVITNGSGPVPTASDMVSVTYTGTLIDGKVFDSGTHEFPVGGVIRGWTEALQKMPVGSKWKLFIPSDLAYGERGNRGIPPDSTLIFVTPDKAREILDDQVACMGCLSQCRFSNWSHHEPDFTNGKKADPRSFCIQKTLQDIAHESGSDSVLENNLMFSGHNAYRFGSDPFYGNIFFRQITDVSSGKPVPNMVSGEPVPAWFLNQAQHHGPIGWARYALSRLKRKMLGQA